MRESVHQGAGQQGREETYGPEKGKAGSGEGNGAGWKGAVDVGREAREARWDMSLRRCDDTRAEQAAGAVRERL